MNELLILYFLSKNQTTMYGLSKSIASSFGAITKPSFGTLQPALKKLENLKYVFASRFYTQGGKPSCYYSLTEEGESYLKEKLLKTAFSNPIQFVALTKIKIACSDILSEQQKNLLYNDLKLALLKLKQTAQKSLSNSEGNRYFSLVADNTVNEYENLITLIEGLENAGNS